MTVLREAPSQHTERRAAVLLISLRACDLQSLESSPQVAAAGADPYAGTGNEPHARGGGEVLPAAVGSATPRTLERESGHVNREVSMALAGDEARANALDGAHEENRPRAVLRSKAAEILGQILDLTSLCGRVGALDDLEVTVTCTGGGGRGLSCLDVEKRELDGRPDCVPSV